MRHKRNRLRSLFVSNALRATLATCIVLFSFLYVLQTNAVSTKGYAISDLESNLVVLERENRRLEVEIAKNKSMQSIQDRLVDKDLVAVNSVDYIDSAGSAVAQR